MRNSFKINIFFLILTFIGIYFIPKLSVRLNPSRSLASITINYHWQNASSFALERQITTPLETGFSTIKGIQKINSKSSKGYGYITLDLDKFTNIDIVRFEISSIIRRLYKKLPKQASYPTVQVNKPDEESNQAFLSYAIIAPLTPFEIQETTKNIIVPNINGIKGINTTNIYGANPKEWVINYQANYLKQLNISKSEISTALQNHFNKTSLGEVFYNEQFLTVAIYPTTKKVTWQIPIKKIGERIIYLTDIAKITQKEQEAYSYYRINGLNSINLSITANKGVNTITLANTIDTKLKKLQENLPNNFKIIQNYNATTYIKTELNKIYNRTAYTIIILLLFILIVSRSWRYLLITILSLIANLSISFLLFWLFGVEIQLYSLAGLTISLGLILDNSIVMIDHIKQQANRNVFIPIFASTLTTIGALSIIYFLDEKYKINLIDFALVIIINLGVSLAIALFLIPSLLDKMPLKKGKKKTLKYNKRFINFYAGFIKITLRYKKLMISFAILLFGIPFFMLPQKLESNVTWYEKTYNTTLGNEWYRENLRPHIDRYLGGSFRLFNYYVFESAQYNRNEQTKLYITAAMEKGATVHQMNEAFLQIENYLLQFNQIKQFTTNVYSGDYARTEVAFKKEFEKSSFPFILKSKMIRKALDLGGIDWSIYGVGNGFNNGSNSNDPINFSVKATGYNYDDLNIWADTLKLKLLKHPRIQKVEIRDNSTWRRKPSYQYVLNLDKELLALYKNSPQTLYQNLNEFTLSKYQDLNLTVNGKYLPIRFESNESQNFDFWHIKNTLLGSKENPISLKNIATITKEKEDENIYKENQEYIRKVEFQYTGSMKFGSKYLDKQLKELETQLPIGYKFERRSNNWYFGSDKTNNYIYLLVLVFLIIYFITAILFESFKQPLIILSVIPISFIGVFLTFYLFDFNFDQGGMASFILLSGITVNASIYILNEFNKLRKKFYTKNSLELYLIAYKQKIFPIILTIVSTIFGFIPFIINGQNEVFWFALAVGTIGGLLLSLIAILIYLPIFTLKKIKSPVTN